MSLKTSINKLVNTSVKRETFAPAKNQDAIPAVKINAGFPGTGDGTTNGTGVKAAKGTEDPNKHLLNSINLDAGTTTSGAQDILAVIDGTAGPQARDNSANTSDFAATDDGVQASQGATGFRIDKLTGLIGLTDCSTGQGVNFRLDGNYIAPPGWVNADTPPPDDGWLSGVVWQIAGGIAQSPGGIYASASAAAKALAASRSAYYSSAAWSGVKYTEEYTGLGSITALTGGSVDYQVSATLVDTGVTNSAADNTFTWLMYGFNCSRPNINSQFCSLTAAPTPTAWPTDGKYDLAIISGKIKSHALDTEAPASAAAGTTSVVLCATGGRKVKIEPAIYGGTMIYEVNATTGIGLVRVYNKDGSLRAIGDHSTQFVQSNLPK